MQVVGNEKNMPASSIHAVWTVNGLSQTDAAWRRRGNLAIGILLSAFLWDVNIIGL